VIPDIFVIVHNSISLGNAQRLHNDICKRL